MKYLKTYDSLYNPEDLNRWHQTNNLNKLVWELIDRAQEVAKTSFDGNYYIDTKKNQVDYIFDLEREPDEEKFDQYVKTLEAYLNFLTVTNDVEVERHGSTYSIIFNVKIEDLEEFQKKINDTSSFLEGHKLGLI